MKIPEENIGDTLDDIYCYWWNLFLVLFHEETNKKYGRLKVK